MEYTTPVIAAREVSPKGVTEWVAANHCEDTPHQHQEFR